MIEFLGTIKKPDWTEGGRVRDFGRFKISCSSCGHWVELEGTSSGQKRVLKEDVVPMADFFSEDLCQVCHEGLVTVKEDG